MAEYISREAAEEIFAYGKEDWKDYEAAACIAALPSADVAPVRHGRWREGAYAGYRCSECRTTWDAPTKFCPNCGADMREVDNGRL